MAHVAHVAHDAGLWGWASLLTRGGGLASQNISHTSPVTRKCRRLSGMALRTPRSDAERVEAALERSEGVPEIQTVMASPCRRLTWRRGPSMSGPAGGLVEALPTLGPGKYDDAVCGLGR